MLQGLTVRSYKSLLDEIKSLGFNAVRILFSSQMLITSRPSNATINFALNPDLQGLSPLQCLDQVVKYCGSIGIRIILSRQSCIAGNTWNEHFWFIPGDPYYTQAQFIADLQALAIRYAGLCFKPSHLFHFE